MTMIEEEAPSAYSRQVGERLRVIRKQKRLSLQEVESAIEQEFKASVLGAYERGERALSVPRLDRLAQFYAVPVEQLLPREVTGAEATAALEAPANKKLAIDVVKLVQLKGAPFEMLSRYLRLIQVQRQDFNGKVITVRGDDVRAIAAMLDVPVDQVGARLDGARPAVQARLTPSGGPTRRLRWDLAVGWRASVRGVPPHPVLRVEVRLLRVRHVDRSDHLVGEYLAAVSHRDRAGRRCRHPGRRHDLRRRWHADARTRPTRCAS